MCYRLPLSVPDGGTSLFRARQSTLRYRPRRSACLCSVQPAVGRRWRSVPGPSWITHHSSQSSTSQRTVPGTDPSPPPPPTAATAATAARHRLRAVAGLKFEKPDGWRAGLVTLVLQDVRPFGGAWCGSDWCGTVVAPPLSLPLPSLPPYPSTPSVEGESSLNRNKQRNEA